MKYIITYFRGNEHDLKGREDFPEKREGERNPNKGTNCMQDKNFQIGIQATMKRTSFIQKH